MITTTQQPRADLVKVALKVGGELPRHTDTLRALRLSVLRIKKDVEPVAVELEMASDGKGGDAPGGVSAKS